MMNRGPSAGYRRGQSSSDHFWTICLHDSRRSIRQMACGALAVKVQDRSTGVTSLAAPVRPPIARYKD